MNPDLLANGRRNPPKAWVYALHESWMKENENYIIFSELKKNLKRRKKEEADKSNLKTDDLDELNSSFKKNPVSHQKSNAPCIIRMNNKLNDDYEDLNFLNIPNEVEDLFCKYFDSGLDVSGAMKLHEENVKKNKLSPSFNPSERLVMFIYINWCKQKKLFYKANENTDILLDCDNVKSVPCNYENDSNNLQSAVQKLKRVTQPQVQTDSAANNNDSPENCVSILPLPPVSKITVESTSAHVENVNIPHQHSELMFDLNTKFSKTVSPVSNVYYLFKSKNQPIPPNNSSFQNSFLSVINTCPVIPVKSVSNSIQVSPFSLPRTSSSDSMSNVTSNVKENFLSSGGKKTGLPTSLNSDDYFSSFFNISPNLSAFDIHSNASDFTKKEKIPNDSDSCNQKVSSPFQSSIFDDPNSSFELNSQRNKSEMFSFSLYVDQNSESVLPLGSGVKDLSSINLPVVQKSPMCPSFSSSCSQSHEMKANSLDHPDLDVVIESENSKCVPIVMNINSVNPIQRLSKKGILHNKAEKTGSASQTKFFEENEDHQFLMSLLPKFMSIPDSFKMKLKKEMHDLILSTKLVADKCKEKGT